MSRNTALVFRYRGSGRTATTGEVFLVRAVSRGISQPLTHRLSLRAEALIHSVHVLLKWHTEFGHLNRGDMLTSEQHRCSNEKKKFQRRV
ncbi:hypothetical protein CCV29_26375 [Escherichia coli]|nr:hypothetical protein [Escherichia coli]